MSSITDSNRSCPYCGGKSGVEFWHKVTSFLDWDGNLQDGESEFCGFTCLDCGHVVDFTDFIISCLKEFLYYVCGDTGGDFECEDE